MTTAERRVPLTNTEDPGLMARLVRLQLLANEQFEAIAADHGIAFGDYLVLGVIRRAPNGQCAPSFVCEMLHRTSGGMTLTLDRLQEAGWVQRQPDPSDRRRIVLRLTTPGRTLARTVNAALHDWEAAMGASTRRHDAMVRALDDLLDLMEPEPARV